MDTALRRRLALLGTAAIGTFLVVLCQFAPWWTWRGWEPSSPPYEMTFSVGLLGWEERETTWGELYVSHRDYWDASHIGPVSLIARILGAGAITLGFSYVVLEASRPMSPHLRAGLKKVVVGATFIAWAEFAFVSAFLPGAALADFHVPDCGAGLWGSCTGDPYSPYPPWYNQDWGAAWGWYVALAGCILISCAMALRMRRWGAENGETPSR